MSWSGNRAGEVGRDGRWKLVTDELENFAPRPQNHVHGRRSRGRRALELPLSVRRPGVARLLAGESADGHSPAKARVSGPRRDVLHGGVVAARNPTRCLIATRQAPSLAVANARIPRVAPGSQPRLSTE